MWHKSHFDRMLHLLHQKSMFCFHTSILGYKERSTLFTDSILCAMYLLDRKQSVKQSVIVFFSKRFVVDCLAWLQDPVDDSHDDNDREPPMHATCSVWTQCEYLLLSWHSTKKPMFQFLVFHHGGLTALFEYNITKDDGLKEIVCLFIMLAMWCMAEDAGFVTFCNNTTYLLPGDQNGRCCNCQVSLHPWQDDICFSSSAFPNKHSTGGPWASQGYAYISSSTHLHTISSTTFLSCNDKWSRNSSGISNFFLILGSSVMRVF